MSALTYSKLHSTFILLEIDTAADNVAIICKRLNALVIKKELRFNGGNSTDKNGTYDKINSNMENDIINEYKEYLSTHYGIKLNSKIETLRLMYWIPNMHKYSVGSLSIIASPKCALKTL